MLSLASSSECCDHRRVRYYVDRLLTRTSPCGAQPEKKNKGGQGGK